MITPGSSLVGLLPSNAAKFVGRHVVLDGEPVGRVLSVEVRAEEPTYLGAWLVRLRFGTVRA